jgi:hypothetical protein
MDLITPINYFFVQQYKHLCNKEWILFNFNKGLTRLVTCTYTLIDSLDILNSNSILKQKNNHQLSVINKTWKSISTLISMNPDTN